MMCALRLRSIADVTVIEAKSAVGGHAVTHMNANGNAFDPGFNLINRLVWWGGGDGDQREPQK